MKNQPMNNIVFFDYDETLITGNSFPRWVLFLLARSLSGFKVSMVMQIVGLLGKRKLLRVMSHRDFKQKMMMLDVPDEWNEAFADILAKSVRSELVNALKEALQENGRVVVSSAAPESYLRPAVGKLVSGWATVPDSLSIIGSKLVDGVLFDNYKEGKVVSLVKHGLLDDESCIEILYTDSWDDAAIAGHAKKVCLVSPSDSDEQEYVKFLGRDRVDVLRAGTRSPTTH